MYKKKKLFTEKTSFSVDYVKFIELHVVHTLRQMQSGYMKYRGNDIFKNDQQKLKHFEKIVF